jgi:hypothetical protein
VQNLSKDDLHENFLLIRKINRMQLAEQRAGEDSDEDDDEPAPRKRQKQEHGDENKNKIRSTIKSEVFDLGSPSGEDDE